MLVVPCACQRCAAPLHRLCNVGLDSSSNALLDGSVRAAVRAPCACEAANYAVAVLPGGGAPAIATFGVQDVKGAIHHCRSGQLC